MTTENEQADAPHHPQVPTAHAGQNKIYALPGRFKVAICGRRFGKTVAAAIEAVRMCEKAAENSFKRIWWISPVQEQADRVEREIAYWLSGSAKGEVRGAKNGKTETEKGRGGDGAKTEREWLHLKSEHALVHFPSQSRIEFHSAHVPDRLRGAGLDLVIIDEAADIEDYTWKMVIKPMLLDARGQAIILGTPRGTKHWLHRVYLMGQDAEKRERYSSIRLPTRENTRIPLEEIEEYRAEMTDEEFRQEFEAEFIDGVNAAFTNVDACVDGEPLVRGLPRAKYITGIDLGQLQDFTVLCSINVHTERLEGFARFNKMDWRAQIPRIAAHLEAFPGWSLVDATGLGSPVAELIEEIPGMRGRCERFVFTQSSRQDILAGLQVTFQYQRIRLARVEVLMNELRGFTLKGERDESGLSRNRYGVPAGLHDDCVMSLALAWWGLKKRALWGGGGNGLVDGFFGARAS